VNLNKLLRDADQSLVAIGVELEKNLDNWEAWAAKADILCSVGMYESAIRCCDKSLAINPDNVLTLTTKTEASIRLGKHEDVASTLAKEPGV
jgi:tetratricopeptide (TPR) repeat protein